MEGYHHGQQSEAWIESMLAGTVVSEDERSHQVSDEGDHQMEHALQMSRQVQYGIPTLAAIPVDANFDHQMENALQMSRQDQDGIPTLAEIPAVNTNFDPPGLQMSRQDEYGIPTLAAIPVDANFVDPVVSTRPPEVSETDSQDDRIQQGLCPNCGTQLFKQKKGRPILGRFLAQKKGKSRAKPLTIDGVVNRGQCLQCLGSASNYTPTSPHSRANVTGQAAIADLEPEATATEAILEAPRSSAVYHGPYNEYGQFHGGPAEFTWSNGDRYVGTFWNGQRHGTECSLFFADGSEYIGTFEHNHLHGPGTRRFADGSVYSGDYHRGKRHGNGKYYYANGDLAVGDWSEDYLVHGKYHYANGQVYEGRFVSGLRHGRGKYTWTNGQSEVHRYENDVRAGDYGVRWNPKRTKAWKLQGKKVTKVSMDEAVVLATAL